MRRKLSKGAAAGYSQGGNQVLDKMGIKFVYGVQHSLQETADMFGITKERVRQIEKKALAKIRKALKVKCGITSLEGVLR